MLTETFCHVPGYGPVKEKKLWASGTATWWDAMDHRHALIGAADGPLHKTIHECLKEYHEGFWELTASMLDRNDHWRGLCLSNPEGLVHPLRWLALDIETTGLDPVNGQVTAIGLCGHATGFAPVALVADHDNWASELPRLMADSDVLITFNGRSFDVPFMARSMQHMALIFPPFHVDLCIILRKLGVRGGLKRIQKRLGFRRDAGLEEVSGMTAIRLWAEHQKGTPGARETLVRYCLEDVVVLFDLACWAYNQAALHLNRQWQCWQPPAVSLHELPYDPMLVKRLVGRWK
jgi:uncharacterized protein